MFAGMRVLKGACLASMVVLFSISMSAGSVTGYYYTANVAATADVQGNGTGGPYVFTEHYHDADTDGAVGSTPVSAHVEVMACPADYVWDGRYPYYPRANSNAFAGFLSIGMNCSSSDGLIGMDTRCSASGTANGSAEARFEIDQTDSWTLSLTGQGFGPWLTGDMGAELFDSNMSSVHQWSKTWSDDHMFTLSSTGTFSCGTYYLYLWASGSACAIYGEPDSANVWIQAQVQCIPAPGVLLLGGIGLGLVRWFRGRSVL